MPVPFAFHIQYIMQQRNTSARLWGVLVLKKMFLVLDGCYGRMGVFLIVIVFVLIQLLTNWCK